MSNNSTDLNLLLRKVKASEAVVEAARKVLAKRDLYQDKDAVELSEAVAWYDRVSPQNGNGPPIISRR